MLHNVLNFFASLWPVKNYPGGKIVGEVEKPVVNPCRNKQKVSGLERCCYPVVNEFSFARNDNIHFIFVVNVLIVNFVWLVNFYGEAAVVKKGQKLFAATV